MPSEHTPEWSKIRALKAKIQTGRCTASGGRVGRELTEEELEDCRERLAQLEQKRDQGIHDRRVARETLDNTEQFKEGQRKFAQVNSRLNTVIAPSGSSAHHRLLAKEVAKREREEQKQRLLLQQGIVPKEGDFYVGTVLIKADALDQVEELRDRDLEAEFSLTGLQCRLVQISGLSGIVHLLAPDLAVLKGKRQDLAHYHLKLQAFHKDVFYENLAWKEGSPAHLDGEGKKLPKHASLRLVVPDLVRIALAKLPRSAPPGLTEPQLGEAKKDDPSTPEPTTEQVEPTAVEPTAVEPKELWEMEVHERVVQRRTGGRRFPGLVPGPPQGLAVREGGPLPHRSGLLEEERHQRPEPKDLEPVEKDPADTVMEPAAEEPADTVMEPPRPLDSSDSQGDAAGPVPGLRTTDKGDGWRELRARTLEEYTADLEIIKLRLNDGTIDKVSLRWSPTRWTQEVYHINTQQKLALKIAKRSVLPRDALVQVHVA
ncbi:hypothetical protein AK812_SmicGene17624 [Symbiodinium microadriaticum]|uniref:Uncharacterized protein n=1 Tax=Symbiodinium microadriaticum TaxID=2951 RepID=A0A1Q9DX82_SYMMI|nr:hypothetical protein AK812_SmicGene17624 [Symbiodinium microadriaticum]